jgi:hypothetical protein
VRFAYGKADGVLRDKTVFAKPFCPSNSLCENSNKFIFTEFVKEPDEIMKSIRTRVEQNNPSFIQNLEVILLVFQRGIRF